MCDYDYDSDEIRSLDERIMDLEDEVEELKKQVFELHEILKIYGNCQ